MYPDITGACSEAGDLLAPTILKPSDWYAQDEPQGLNFQEEFYHLHEFQG
jgi:hypothetical protein